MAWLRRSRASRKRKQREIADSERMLPDGCGYMGRDFGAPYTDSQCFGGRLYDLDNGENGRLYEPLEYLPCPDCNHEMFLENCLENADSDGMSAFCKGRPREFVSADKLRYPQDHAVLQEAFFRGWDYAENDSKQEVSSKLLDDKTEVA